VGLCFVLIHFVGVFKNLGQSDDRSMMPVSALISAAYHFRQGVNSDDRKTQKAAPFCRSGPAVLDRYKS
jgi:hypothetical protein